MCVSFYDRPYLWLTRREQLVEAAALQRFNEGAAAVIRAALSVSDGMQGPDEIRSGALELSHLNPAY